MQKLTPCLWYDGQADEAVGFYISIFKDARIKQVMPGPGGKALGITFELAGQEFFALNGGPQYKFSPATSFFIHCKTQEEVDYYWDSLTADGGAPVQCGWLTDKYGMSWQVVPDNLMKYMNDQEHPAKAASVMQAMMKMVKIDVQAVEDAYNNA